MDTLQQQSESSSNQTTPCEQALGNSEKEKSPFNRKKPSAEPVSGREESAVTTWWVKEVRQHTLERARGLLIMIKFQVVYKHREGRRHIQYIMEIPSCLGQLQCNYGGFRVTIF